jgi:hypothetical protein
MAHPIGFPNLVMQMYAKLRIPVNINQAPLDFERRRSPAVGIMARGFLREKIGRREE